MRNNNVNDLMQGFINGLCPPRQRAISDIAIDIINDWKNVHFGAVPYLEAMQEIDGVDDEYYLDSPRTIINYFLSNAGTWKGEVARRIKTELKELVKHG